MKLTILTQELKKGLNYTERLTGRNLTLPILNNVLLEATTNFLKISSTDLETGIEWWGLCKTESEGKITIPAKILTQVINNISDEKIEIEDKNDTLFIKTKSFKTQIKGYTSDDFPIIPQFSKEECIEISAQELKESLVDVVDIASLSQIRPEISGIYFVFKKDSVNLVATDSFRLVERTVKSNNYKNSFNEEIKFILSQKTTKEVINVIQENTGLVKIYYSESQILFETTLNEVDHPEIDLISRQIEGNYPAYKEIIPKEYKTRIIVPKDELVKQIKLAGLFAGKINEVKFKNDDKNLEILSQDIELGENSSILEAKIEGETTEISFNYKFILDGVNRVKTKNVLLELQGPSGAGVIKAEEGIDYIYVVMPIKR
ncbi:MAG: DNA polymerase III subunit beta, partial [Candidatus Pacebacteria bacterium]|nr:DNA polymerase III subunit beta [Candidatus Paceibacterota bacterium]MDD4333936.1 DNA polymerase III subunit beta [Candidatus Paceibacterota bacterium]